MKKTLTLVIVSFIILAVGSAYSQKASAGKKAPKTKTITIKKNYLSVQKINGKKSVVYSPDSRRKTSHYRYYVFDYDEFKNKLGNPKKPAKTRIKIRIIKTTVKKHTPSNPNMPSPAGGFTYTYYSSKIMEPDLNKGKIKTLIIKKRYLSVLRPKGKLAQVVYSPGNDRKSASYTKYYFSYKEFLKKVGDPKKLKQVQIQIMITKTETKKWKPSDPRMSAPAGGFTFNHHSCKIIKKF